MCLVNLFSHYWYDTALKQSSFLLFLVFFLLVFCSPTLFSVKSFKVTLMLKNRIHILQKRNLAELFLTEELKNKHFCVNDSQIYSTPNFWYFFYFLLHSGQGFGAPRYCVQQPWSVFRQRRIDGLCISWADIGFARHLFNCWLIQPHRKKSLNPLYLFLILIGYFVKTREMKSVRQK